MEGDESAHGMADQMRRCPTLRVHERERVFGHLRDAQTRSEGLAAAQAAIVEPEALVVRGECVDLRSPSAAVDADALDEDDGRSAARDLVGEVAAFVGAAFVEDSVAVGSFGNFGRRHGGGWAESLWRPIPILDYGGGMIGSPALDRSCEDCRGVLRERLEVPIGAALGGESRSRGAVRT